MKSKSLVLLAVAAGCGLVAMLGVQQMLSGGKTPAQAKIRILVAKADIDPGVPLEKTNVGFKEWPKDAIPEGAITKEDEFAERALKHRVGPGQPILLTELGKKGDYGVEVQIPEGMTLVSYPVSATMTHSGLLKPGSYVDVSAAIEYPKRGGGKQVEIKPVLQCVQVIAVGNQIAGTEAAAEATPKDAKNVSFLVFPRQGQLLQLAFKKSNGAIQLALRGKTDKSLANTGDLTEQSMSMLSNQLLGETEESKANAAGDSPVFAKPKTSIKSLVKRQTGGAEMDVGNQSMQRTWKIEVYQGDKKEVQEIAWPEEPVVQAIPTSPQATSGWTNPLMQFFSGRPKKAAVTSDDTDTDTDSATESKGPVEHRPSSLVRRRPEDAPVEDNNVQP